VRDEIKGDHHRQPDQYQRKDQNATHRISLS
jgi:hypothetical protein